LPPKMSTGLSAEHQTAESLLNDGKVIAAAQLLCASEVPDGAGSEDGLESGKLELDDLVTQIFEACAASSGAEAHLYERVFDELARTAIDLSFGTLLRISQFPNTARLPKQMRLFIQLVGACLEPGMPRATQLAATVGNYSYTSAIILAARIALANGELNDALRRLLALSRTHRMGLSVVNDLRACLNYRDLTTFRLRDNLITKQKHKLAICSSLKNEAEYLEEWVSFHHGIGVEHFYLYENQSTDDTRRKIKELAKRFPITLRVVDAQPGQQIATRHYIHHHATDAEWTAFIDGDEYINLETASNIQEVLDRNAFAAAIACSWMSFGSAGHIDTPEGTCLESFTRRGATRARHVKSIVRTAKIIHIINPHQFLMDGLTVRGDGEAVMLFQGKENPPEQDDIRIHHYAVKSHAQWRAKKERGRPLQADDPRRLRDDSYFKDNDLNDVEDRSILRLVRTAAKVKDAV
jgi:hypothetical protein